MLTFLACMPRTPEPPAVAPPVGEPPALSAPADEPPATPVGDAARVQSREVVLDPAVAERGCDRLDPALWALAATSYPVLVVLDITGPTLLPKLFEVQAETPLAVQGTVPGDYLCALAALETVTRVRPPALAVPKEAP